MKEGEEIVAYRFNRKVENKENLLQDWMFAYHGTREENALSIFRHGLKKAGEKAGDSVVTIPQTHFTRNRRINGIDGWAMACFASRSIRYASHPCYCGIINSEKGEQWKVLVELGVKKDSFQEFRSTIPSFKLAPGEDKNVEMRIQAHEAEGLRIFPDKSEIAYPFPETNIVVFSVLLFKAKCIDTIGFRNQIQTNHQLITRGPSSQDQDFQKVKPRKFAQSELRRRK